MELKRNLPFKYVSTGFFEVWCFILLEHSYSIAVSKGNRVFGSPRAAARWSMGWCQPDNRMPMYREDFSMLGTHVPKIWTIVYFTFYIKYLVKYGNLAKLGEWMYNFSEIL